MPSSRCNPFDLADDDSDIVREAKQRWNNRLVIEDAGFSFADAYLKGRLWIALEFDGPWSSREYKLIARMAAEEGVHNSKIAVAVGDNDPQPCQLSRSAADAYPCWRAC